MIFNSNLNLLKAIGNTPCVKLENISKLTNHEVWAKLEFMNPGGSIKDRIAMYMIEKAEKDFVKLFFSADFVKVKQNKFHFYYRRRPTIP